MTKADSLTTEAVLKSGHPSLGPGSVGGKLGWVLALQP